MIFDTRTLVRGITESQEAFNQKIYNLVDNNLKDILGVKKKRVGSKWLEEIEDYETSHDHDYIFKPRDGEDYDSQSFEDRTSNFLRYKRLAMEQRDDEILNSIKKKESGEDLNTWLIRANNILNINYSIIHEPRVEFGETWQETENRINQFRDARDEIKVQIRTAQDKTKYNDSLALSKKKEEDKINLRKKERDEIEAKENKLAREVEEEEEREIREKEDIMKYKLFILTILSILGFISFNTYSRWNGNIGFWVLVGLSLILFMTLFIPSVYKEINEGKIYRGLMIGIVYFLLSIKFILKH